MVAKAAKVGRTVVLGKAALSELVPRKRMSKEDVLREATRLFAEKGYDGLSMGDLAARLGLRKASLFHHFPTKDAMYERVLATLVEAVQQAIADAISSKGSTLERLDKLSDLLTAALGEHPHAARLLVSEAIHGGPTVRDGFGTKVGGALAAARTFVRAGQREGVFDRELDPTHVVLSVVGSCFLPFAMADIVDRFAGTRPDHPAFIGARTVAMREQLRRMLRVRS
jgi:TetR/AcrR family transcriptional regulator